MTGDGRQIGSCLIELNARLQSSENSHHSKVTIRNKPVRRSGRTARSWHIDVVFHRILWNRRQNANYSMRAIVHLKDFAYDVRIAAETFLPIVKAQHQYRIGAAHIIAGNESSAHQRLHTQNVKEVCRDYRSLNAFWLVLAIKNERH